MSTLPDECKFTYDDYALIPNDGKRHEIINGVHYVNAAPNSYHQLILGRLFIQLNAKIADLKHGIVFLSPFDVQLDSYSVIQPDITVILNDRRPFLTKAKLDGAPSLVIEILSPSNPNHDRETKRKLYQQHSIPEFWLVDPEKEVVEQLVLIDGAYCPTANDASHPSITLSLLPDVSVNITGLFEFDF